MIPQGYVYYVKSMMFKQISRKDILAISCEIALSWMPQELTDGKSTMVHVMAWCRQACSPSVYYDIHWCIYTLIKCLNSLSEYVWVQEKTEP